VQCVGGTRRRCVPGWRVCRQLCACRALAAGRVFSPCCCVLTLLLPLQPSPPHTHHQIAETGRKVHVVAPDYAEYARSYKL
jgi:hypothetical protein